MQDPGVRVEQLLHLEAIRLLRPRYCRFVDLKMWDEFEDLFTPDVQIFSSFAADARPFFSNSDPGGAPRKELVAKSPAEFRARVSALTDGASTAHACFNPEIELLADRLAHGIWAMHDIVSHPAKPNIRFTGGGHYEDEYRLCDDGRWRISKAALTRIRMDPLPLREVDAVTGQPTGKKTG